MKKLDYLVNSFVNAALVFVYISGIAWFGFNSHRIFGQTGKPDNFLAPLFVLLLFVVSASITGLLVLGKPINLYLSNQKREAFTLLGATVAWLVVFLLLVATALLSR